MGKGNLARKNNLITMDKKITDEGYSPKHRLSIDKPDARDFIAEHILGAPENEVLPEEAVWMTDALNQGDSVFCTAFSCYHVGKILNEIEHMRKLDVDAVTGWEKQKLFGTHDKNGDFVQTALKSIVKNGVILTDGNNLKIDGYAKIDKSMIKYYIAKGMPIVTSTVVTSTNYKNAKTKGFWTGNDGTVKGGHAVAIIGYDKEGNYIVLNSYGKDWGFYKNGTFKIKEEHIGDIGTSYIVYDHIDAVPIFRDVTTASPYKEEIMWAVENKIAQGYGDSSLPATEKFFMPNQPITRMQAVLMLYRFSKLFYNQR